ncbi:MAG: hypothetical protein KC656_32630, partial [Myxococcales bacterium]|nr:hypothetical protein [Myxococcales bacterium]
DPSSGAAVSDWFAHMVEAEPPWRVLDSAEGKPPAQKVSIELLEVWPGKKYQDTCVSRVDIMTIDPEEL